MSDSTYKTSDSNSIIVATSKSFYTTWYNTIQSANFLNLDSEQRTPATICIPDVWSNKDVIQYSRKLKSYSLGISKIISCAAWPNSVFPPNFEKAKLRDVVWDN